MLTTTRPSSRHCSTTFMVFSPIATFKKIFSSFSCPLIQFILQISIDLLIYARHCFRHLLHSSIAFCSHFLKLSFNPFLSQILSQRDTNKIKKIIEWTSYIYIIFSAYSNNNFTDFLWFQNIVRFAWMPQFCVRRHPICVCIGFKDFLLIILPFSRIAILICPLFSKSGKIGRRSWQEEKERYIYIYQRRLAEWDKMKVSCRAGAVS